MRGWGRGFTMDVWNQMHMTDPKRKRKGINACKIIVPQAISATWRNTSLSFFQSAGSAG